MTLFNILAIGDVFGEPGRKYLLAKLSGLKAELGAGLCIVNGENSHDGIGINSDAAAELFAAGADVITTGNHAFTRAGASLFDNKSILRPANYHSELPGSGICLVDCGVVVIAVINLSGTVFMSHADNPFDAADACLREVEKTAAITVIDFHAEATSEKTALGLYLDGRAGFVYGTHTHIQTADERILPQGTAYITDLGFVGVENSVIGFSAETGIPRLRTGAGGKGQPAQGGCTLCGALVTFDRATSKAVSIKRVKA